ncbi:hypothetical protein Scep_012643 [Stephania cephalantha]|uniref:Uncharacterized protein n=1 Tax=Stephania cephalantha TaxID=152367 RepID=A0AAP0JGB9_9MAGN
MGVCTSMEVLVKKSESGEKWRLNRVVSGVLTIGFVMGTSFWLFFPQIVRNGVDLRTIEELGIASRWIKDRLVLPPVIHWLRVVINLLFAWSVCCSICTHRHKLDVNSVDVRHHNGIWVPS